MNEERTLYPMLNYLFHQAQEEAEEILENIDESAFELVKDLKIFRNKLQELENIREERELLTD